MGNRRVGVWVLLLAAGLALGACNLGISGSAGDGPTGENGGKGEELESAGGGFVWRREGGIAGFCDVVSVESDDAAFVESCRAEPPEPLGDVELSAAQAALLDDLVARLDSFTHEQSDPATADALTITIVFAGVGDAQPSDEDIAAIDALAIELLRAVAEQN